MEPAPSVGSGDRHPLHFYDYTFLSAVSHSLHFALQLFMIPHCSCFLSFLSPHPQLVTAGPARFSQKSLPVTDHRHPVLSHR